jgi:hypothetical protein
VHLEASTKPPIHNLIHEFLINMAFTMACPNFKKGLKMAFGPLGVKRKLHEKIISVCANKFLNYQFTEFQLVGIGGSGVV